MLKKVETNYEQHVEYQKHLKDTRNWIENAKEVIRTSTENASSSASKEELQASLNQVGLLTESIIDKKFLFLPSINIFGIFFSRRLKTF